MRKRYPRFKSVVINIRGSNGSGKTTLVKRILERFGNIPLHNGFLEKPKKVWGYRVLDNIGFKIRPGNYRLPYPVHVYVVGPYETPTGGCDPLPNFDFICKAVRNLARSGHVIFEGALVSTVAGRWIELQKEMEYSHFIFGVLDTPQQRCVKRVNKRREAKGKEPIDPTRTMDGKFKAVLSSTRMLKREGMDVRTLPHKKAMKTILDWLGERHGRS